MAEAMNLSYGDLILIQMTLLEKMGSLDLTMQSGVYFSELMGRIEFQLQLLKEAAGKQRPNIDSDPPLKP